ncbi:MAG TPA: hypothetical protein VGX92_09325 [Pyrinomonadaceae bacterium]|nr:hypothetical protein [Pyrinomonadaceae bacterium]
MPDSIAYITVKARIISGISGDGPTRDRGCCRCYGGPTGSPGALAHSDGAFLLKPATCPLHHFGLHSFRADVLLNFARDTLQNAKARGLRPRFAKLTRAARRAVKPASEVRGLRLSFLP